MFALGLLVGGGVVFVLAVLLVFLIPGKAIKFALKNGMALERKIGSEKVAALRGLAEKL